ncbi:MAG TPA: glycosyltransferase [Chthoniobacterales bacterium]
MTGITSSTARRLLVASYCTHFLKQEMRHIYRQVTTLRGVDTFVIAKFREHPEQYPFPDVATIGRPRVNPLRRAWLKYGLRQPSFFYRGEFEATRRLLIRRDPDLMHIYFGNTGVHLLSLIRAWDRPCVVSFHGMDVQTRPKERGYAADFQAMLKAVALVLVRSESIGQRLVSLGCPAEKIRLNRTGIPLAGFPFVERAAPADGAWQVVQACRLIAKKGLPTALRAFQVFSRRFPHARFTIAGTGPLAAQLATYAKELGLQEKVVFTGFLTQEQLQQLFAQAHLFCHPSEMTPDANQEGVPNSMLEAMATGLPVVATLHGGIPEAVRDGEHGFLVPEKDPEALAAGLRRLCEDEGLWLRLGRAAHRRVKEEFEQGAQIARLEGHYGEAVERGGRW